MDAANRLQRLFTCLPQLDPFLRTGFRVGSPTARKMLNRLAGDVLTGIAAVDHSVVAQTLESCSRMQASRAAGVVFGIAAGSALRGAEPPLPERYLTTRWRFVRNLGIGFGSGYRKTYKAETNAVLIGKGMYCGYWHWQSYVAEQTRETGHPVMDRGLGAVIWLGSGMDVVTAASLVHSFAMERQPEIWRGLGFAMSFVTQMEDLRSGEGEIMLQASGSLGRCLISGVNFGSLQAQHLGEMEPSSARLRRPVSDATYLHLNSHDSLADWD